MTPLTLLEEPSTTDPVVALLGRTRAAILALLTRQHTTTDLARELDISKSSASEHTKALRHARLVASQRDGRVVWHTCTPLGLRLIAPTTAAREGNTAGYAARRLTGGAPAGLRSVGHGQ